MASKTMQSISLNYSTFLRVEAPTRGETRKIQMASMIPMKQLSIAELVMQCRRENRDAFFELYRRYSRAMLNTAFRITHERGDAEDVLQDAFVSAFENLDDLRDAEGFGAWLKRIVINKAINLIKKRKWEEELPDSEDFEVEEEDVLEDCPIDVERVRAAILKLPDGYRTVLSLYLLEGYDHREISQIMGITESTSKSQLNRSKKKLKELLISMS